MTDDSDVPASWEDIVFPSTSDDADDDIVFPSAKKQETSPDEEREKLISQLKETRNRAISAMAKFFKEYMDPSKASRNDGYKYEPKGKSIGKNPFFIFLTSMLEVENCNRKLEQLEAGASTDTPGDEKLSKMISLLLDDSKITPIGRHDHIFRKGVDTPSKETQKELSVYADADDPATEEISGKSGKKYLDKWVEWKHSGGTPPAVKIRWAACLQLFLLNMGIKDVAVRYFDSEKLLSTTAPDSYALRTLLANESLKCIVLIAAIHGDIKFKGKMHTNVGHAFCMVLKRLDRFHGFWYIHVVDSSNYFNGFASEALEEEVEKQVALIRKENQQHYRTHTAAYYKLKKEELMRGLNRSELLGDILLRYLEQLDEHYLSDGSHAAVKNFLNIIREANTAILTKELQAEKVTGKELKKRLANTRTSLVLVQYEPGETILDNGKTFQSGEGTCAIFACYFAFYFSLIAHVSLNAEKYIEWGDKRDDIATLARLKGSRLPNPPVINPHTFAEVIERVLLIFHTANLNGLGMINKRKKRLAIRGGGEGDDDANTVFEKMQQAFFKWVESMAGDMPQGEDDSTLHT